MCVRSRPHRHAHAVQRHCVRITKSKRLGTCLRLCFSVIVAMYICHFCQHNAARVASSHIHSGIMSKFDMIPQELYTASGEMVSMYKP